MKPKEQTTNSSSIFMEIICAFEDKLLHWDISELQHIKWYLLSKSQYS